MHEQEPKSSPRSFVEQIESSPTLPPGDEERLSGYGVMGLPFASGDILALRRFPASSIGPGYTSVWHRNPEREWTIYTNAPLRQSCPRFFGAIASTSSETEIGITWTGPFRFTVRAPGISFEWEVEVGPTLATRLMNTTGALLPARAWRSPAVLGAMGGVAGPVLRVGRVGLHGTVPNGQLFKTNPRLMWEVTGGQAVLRGKDFGSYGPVHPQAHLGDFWIPQRGMLAIGEMFFEQFDPARHSAQTHANMRAGSDG